MTLKRNSKESCESKKKLIIITGPTAVGKSELSIELAKAIGGSVISADSMQIYKYMDIGTAKIKTSDMQGIKHYLIDVLNPGDEFNAYIFKKMAEDAMDEIYSEGRIPIIVGGTGFYIQALLYDIDFTEGEIDNAYRDELIKKYEEMGPDYLFSMLKEIDDGYASIIHKNDMKRVVRALCYHHETGQKLSEHNEEMHDRKSPYDYLLYVINDDRELLYERIDKRVDKMIAAGLVDEVTRLKEMGYNRSIVSMQGLGYKEILSYLEGEISLDEAIRIIKRDTRHFAKRQLTWFRRERDVIWLNREDYGNSLNEMVKKICCDFEQKYDKINDYE